MPHGPKPHAPLRTRGGPDDASDQASFPSAHLHLGAKLVMLVKRSKSTAYLKSHSQLSAISAISASPVPTTNGSSGPVSSRNRRRCFQRTQESLHPKPRSWTSFDSIRREYVRIRDSLGGFSFCRANTQLSQLMRSDLARKPAQGTD